MAPPPRTRQPVLALARALAVLLVLGAGTAGARGKGPIGQSFEGEAALPYGRAIFSYYRPAPGQKLNRSVVRTLLPQYQDRYRARGSRAGRSLSPRRWSKLSTTEKTGAVSWQSLNDEGKTAYLQALFNKETSRKLLPQFFARYRKEGFPLTEAQFRGLTRKEKLAQVTYANLNQQGQKRFKEVMREVFPMYKSRRVPRAFEEVLFWETPGTFELRHRDKTQRPAEVSRAVRWMKTKISDRVRPHRHLSWKPDLSALTARRKEFLSFVQRVDLLMFSQRLEQRSVGALWGSYGKNFMPYSASKLAEIDRSLVDRTYSLLLGSKLHGLGLRTYRDGSVGLEIRPVSDPGQIDWYADLIRRSVTRGALGAIRYDDSPIELTSVGRSLLGAVRVGAPGRRVTAAWIDGQVQQAGLDQRLSYPLQAWESQAFVPRHRHQLIGRERRRFVGELASLLVARARGTLTSRGLREGAMAAVWRFAGRCRLSADLQSSLTGPLERPAGGPRIIAGP